MKLLRFVFILLAVCVPLGHICFAQQPTATLTGEISDESGGVIPGARITIKKNGTGFSRTAESNAEGVYTFAGLPAGYYSVSISAANFNKVHLFENVKIEVGQTNRLNAILEVSGPTETVTIDGYGPVNTRVDTETSKVDGVINDREIENLPLNGRNFLELALLTPGNSPAPNFDPTKTNSVIISSAGQLGRGGNVMIDGADNNDDVVGGALINISQDAVQEFQVATNRFSAEYGRSASSVINVVTKGGTNEVHGSVSFFARDKRIQELPATFDRINPSPPFDRQQYAVTLGGPIVKNKLFAFGAFEYRNQDDAVLVGVRDVPNQTITRGLAGSSLNDLLFNSRLDYVANESNQIDFRYNFEDVDGTAASTLDRAIGSESYRQTLKNRFHSFVTNWSGVFNSKLINNLSFSLNNFDNFTAPVSSGVQYTFPSILDGSSFRVPQGTKQNRIQISNALTAVAGDHKLRFGGEFQKIDSSLFLGVFQDGRIEFVQDFADADRNNDGIIDDGDLLFAVTLRSQFPERPLKLPDVDNNYFAFFVQDDWKFSRNLSFNIGLRYEVDTNVKNNSGYDDINPLVASFYKGERKVDTNNFAPRLGFNYSMLEDRLSVHGGYGIYYDRIVLQLITLERGLDGRALPIAVRAGNALTDQNGIPIFLDMNGDFLPFAPTTNNPFIGFVLPGAGASGINIIDNNLQNPMIQQSNLGIQWGFLGDFVFKADYIHNFGTHFIIGRNIGVVNNPVVGGPDRVVNLESSVGFKYDGLLLSVEKNLSHGFSFRSAYTLSKAFNYSNDDQIPFTNGPIDSNNLRLDYGPTPNDQRHRFTFAGTFEMPFEFMISPIITLASGVPMDIILPDGSSRIPQIQRNAGGRLFKNANELNAFIQNLNASGGVNGNLLPLAPANARFNDSFSSVDIRVTKSFMFGDRFRLEPIVEVFNLLNTTNILGVSNTNYSGFGNVLGSPGFGQPITTAGGVFGSGGPRALQFGGKFTF